ncbi:hypothetical protein NAS141_02566 [Sulfitobacter sp. NAS-14.1]|nr:hypothetical protein NAS141_02566 [Sulfitobacter sp. NAS-14.1]
MALQYMKRVDQALPVKATLRSTCPILLWQRTM